MITFLPSADFAKSAYVLDKKRLGNQRGETIAILEALENKTSRIYNHVAVRMWRGYTDALVAYGLAICEEWISLGCEDASYDKILAFSSKKDFIPTQSNVVLPLWLGRESFHASHRGNLLRKDGRWYSMFRWKESPILPYEWPMNIPLETLTSLRARGYEPIGEGLGNKDAAHLFCDKHLISNDYLVVVAHDCKFYPCKVLGSPSSTAQSS